MSPKEVCFIMLEKGPLQASKNPVTLEEIESASQPLEMSQPPVAQLGTGDWSFLINVPDCPSGKLERKRVSGKIGSTNKSCKERTATL